MLGPLQCWPPIPSTWSEPALVSPVLTAAVQPSNYYRSITNAMEQIVQQEGGIPPPPDLPSCWTVQGHSTHLGGYSPLCRQVLQAKRAGTNFAAFEFLKKQYAQANGMAVSDLSHLSKMGCGALAG